MCRAQGRTCTGYILWDRSVSKTNVHCLCDASQGHKRTRNKGTGHKGTVYGYGALENLGITEEKILKFSAHIILCVNRAVDKVFRNTEQKIGVQKLLHVNAGEKVFSSPGSSIHTFAIIAISKLLSPSHTSFSMSLYNEYVMNGTIQYRAYGLKWLYCK